MGILDDLLGVAVRGARLSPDMIMKVVSILMQQHGGIGSLVNSFNKAGMGDIVQSWIGTGQNQAVSPGQLSQVLGGGAIGQIASQLGVDQSQTGSILAKLLPHVVDQLTPQGQVHADHNSGGDLLNSAIGALTGKLFSQRLTLDCCLINCQ